MHFTDNDVKVILQLFAFLTLVLTLWKGNQRITRVKEVVDRQSHFNGNKSLKDGGSMVEALTRIEANSEQGRNETRALRESMVTVHGRLGRIESNFDDGMKRLDHRIDKLDDKMTRHIERTEDAARPQ